MHHVRQLNGRVLLTLLKETGGMTRRHILFGGAILLVSIAEGCKYPTDAVLLPVNIEEHVLESVAADEWPFTPEVSGGPVLVVRGTMHFGCSGPVAYAERRSDEVRVRVTIRGTETPCPLLATGWHGYEVRVSGLAAGYYDVIVAQDGLTSRTRVRIRISS